MTKLDTILSAVGIGTKTMLQSPCFLGTSSSQSSLTSKPSDHALSSHQHKTSDNRQSVITTNNNEPSGVNTSDNKQSGLNTSDNKQSNVNVSNNGQSGLITLDNGQSDISTNNNELSSEADKVGKPALDIEESRVSDGIGNPKSNTGQSESEPSTSNESKKDTSEDPAASLPDPCTLVAPISVVSTGESPKSGIVEDDTQTEQPGKKTDVHAGETTENKDSYTEAGKTQENGQQGAKGQKSKFVEKINTKVNKQINVVKKAYDKNLRPDRKPTAGMKFSSETEGLQIHVPGTGDFKLNHEEQDEECDFTDSDPPSDNEP